jgi:bacterioferritin-associated ferredoxin
VIVCHCRAVSDRVIREAIDAGAVEVEDVARLCGAGGDCGGCESWIDTLLLTHEHRVELRCAS